MTVRILTDDVRAMLATLADESVHCVVTSPPYWGLRDYGVAGQLGMEPTLGEHIETMVSVFREVRRVLRKDGTCWLNYGDCYATAPNGRSAADTKAAGNDDRTFRDKPFSTVGPIYDPAGGAKGGGFRGDNLGRTESDKKVIPKGRIVAGGSLKPKDLCQIPNRLAQALQEPYYTGSIKRLEDRVWLAATIDGEGCIFIHRQPEGTQTGRGRKYKRTQDNFCVGIAISNTSEALVAHAAAICGKENLQRYEPTGNRQPHWQWRITGNLAKNILREIYPHLVAKPREARIAINCPPSGDIAAASWTSLKCLHKGQATDFDAPPPKDANLWEQGWWVRSEIIWHKPNPMPESITDRPATAHEKIWLLTKSARYFYDAAAVRTEQKEVSIAWLDRANTGTKVPGQTAHSGVAGPRDAKPDKQRGHGRRHAGFNDRWDAMSRKEQQSKGANLRNVWTVPTRGFSEAHFATFPPALIEPCIKAGCPEGGIVLDPFGGAGTTGLVADRLGRDCILIELNPDYAEMARRRIEKDAGMFASVAAE